VALGGEWCDACSDTRGGSLELSLELAPMAPSLHGLHLRDLQRIGVLTKVFMGVGEVRCMLATRKWTQRETMRSGGSLWCSFGFSSSPGDNGGDISSLATSQAGPRRCEARRWGTDAARAFLDGK
jgi:hypothetical protein